MKVWLVHGSSAEPEDGNEYPTILFLGVFASWGLAVSHLKNPPLSAATHEGFWSTDDAQYHVTEFELVEGD